MKMSSGVSGCNSSHRTNDVYYRKLQYVYKISKYQNVFHSKICFGNKELQKNIRLWEEEHDAYRSAETSS